GACSSPVGRSPTARPVAPVNGRRSTGELSADSLLNYVNALLRQMVREGIITREPIHRERRKFCYASVDKDKPPPHPAQCPVSTLVRGRVYARLPRARSSGIRCASSWPVGNDMRRRLSPRARFAAPVPRPHLIGCS